eukprot:Skav214465  [mRNA]  locus=scaffold1167:37378:38259:+ [translate_table: standard]
MESVLQVKANRIHSTAIAESSQIHQLPSRKFPGLHTCLAMSSRPCRRLMAMMSLVALSCLCASSLPSFAFESLPLTVLAFWAGSAVRSPGLSAEDQIKLEREKARAAEAEREASQQKARTAEAERKASEAKAKQSANLMAELETRMAESKRSLELEIAKQQTIKDQNWAVMQQKLTTVAQVGVTSTFVGTLINFQRVQKKEKEMDKLDQKKKEEVDKLELEQKEEMFQVTQKHMWWKLLKTQADMFSNTICKLVAASVLVYMAYHHVKSTPGNQHQQNAIMPPNMSHFAIAVA